MDARAGTQLAGDRAEPPAAGGSPASDAGCHEWSWSEGCRLGVTLTVPACTSSASWQLDVAPQSFSSTAVRMKSRVKASCAKGNRKWYDYFRKLDVSLNTHLPHFDYMVNDTKTAFLSMIINSIGNTFLNVSLNIEVTHVNEESINSGRLENEECLQFPVPFPKTAIMLPL